MIFVLSTFNCTAFELIDGATLDDGKLKVLKSDSHWFVVTCAVAFEFRSGGLSHSSYSIRIVSFSRAVGKTFLVTTRVQVPSWTGRIFFSNNVFNFHRAYTLPGFVNFNLQRGKTPHLWVSSTEEK